MCAGALNNLLLRKDLCNWSKGIQIRYNISTLEEWARNKNIGEIISTLQPIIQACQLLQARKTEGDVESITEMCAELTINQVSNSKEYNVKGVRQIYEKFVLKCSINLSFVMCDFVLACFSNLT